MSTPAIPMPDRFTLEAFAPHVGEVFRVIVSETQHLDILLTAIERLSADERWKARSRVPFSLVFHAAPGSVIPQQIYRIEHPAMEPFDTFLVPIGPDEHGMRYESIYT